MANFEQLSPILHLEEDIRRHACCSGVILKRALFVLSFSPCIHVDGWIDRQIVIRVIINQDIALLDSTAEYITFI